jgi:hypothetical protein
MYLINSSQNALFDYKCVVIVSSTVYRTARTAEVDVVRL